MVVKRVAKKVPRAPAIPEAAEPKFATVHFPLPALLHQRILKYCAAHPHVTGKRRTIREFFIELADEKLGPAAEVANE